MPEQAEQARQEAQTQPGSRKLALGVAVIIMVMVLEAVIIIVAMMRPKAGSDVPAEGEPAAALAAKPADELLAPYVMVEDVAVTVRMDDTASQHRTLVMGVHLKIGALDNEKSLDLKYLQNEYVPKVQNIVPQIKHLLIREAAARSYAQLRDPSVQQQLLEDIKKYTNDTLQKYGQEPRIIDVGWEQFLFN